ncbi:2'-5' RNA ligase family protein [Sediminibacterium ginsengisoli]|uniref:2'-5' RNA ligase superfamily protein n=1 Tax=Sediminibacterium ginsengisoli TaxID=413434 RepID=A0A1T4M8R9_9BACT|nr:2'-5' RNA ligase family protein [Sediminibacterium ginsengisoli]SJZ63188.1 2'-5' RNA ligase superfamily protein [Sediminibacterium ginsengisoli]
MQQRIQLTLFAEPEETLLIEKVRKAFNPVQFALIRAHVTLCREDMLLQKDMVLKHLSHTAHPFITIRFGKPARFAEGRGLFLPATEDTQFQLLRSHILQDISCPVIAQEPHITLIHPRNATCTDAIFEEVCRMKLPEQLTFKRVSLIEQINGKEWKPLREFPLRG